MRPTFDNQRHYGLGHAKQVAGYAAVGSIIFTTGIGDGQNGTVRTNFGVDCRDKENIRPAEKGKKNRWSLQNKNPDGAELGSIREASS